MRRIERLLNLVALLADAERPLPVDEICARVPGYNPDGGEATRRAFERDKDTVRSMGIELETVAIDPISGPGPDNVGYVLADAHEKVPDPGLTVAERGLLEVASSLIWETEDDDETRDALDAARIGAAGVDFGTVRPPALVGAFLSAISERRRVAVRYRSAGGTEAVQRTISPYGIVHRRGHWYVTGHDSASRETRSFRLDRMDSEVDLGEPHGFTRPSGFRIHEAVPERGWEFGAGVPRTVRIAVDPDHLWWVGPQTGVGAQEETYAAPDGRDWPVLEIPVRNTEVFVGWMLSLLDAALVLDPTEVRRRIEAGLQRICEEQV